MTSLIILLTLIIPPSVLLTSKPSSPYKNCIILLLASLTVQSYSTLKSCNAFASLLYKYPDFGVLNAVSISVDLPVIAPKKNSSGLSPFMNGLAINPFALGDKSPFLKKDRVLSLYPISILLASKSCWPTQQAICVM